MKPTVILGHAPWATEVTLRHVARHLAPADTLVILDTRGLAASVAGHGLLERLHHGHLTWIDTSDRVHPVAFVGFRSGAALPEALRYALHVMMRAHRRERVADDYSALLQAVEQMGGTGNVTLSTLLALLEGDLGPGLSARLPMQAAARVAAQEAIAWAMRYPGVHNLSEGPNRLALGEALSRAGTVWIEVPAQPFEPAEHGLVVSLARAALIQALPQAVEARGDARGRLILAEILPAARDDEEARAWLAAIPPNVRHLCTLHVDSQRGLRPGQVSMATDASALWRTALAGPSDAVLTQMQHLDPTASAPLACGQVRIAGRDGGGGLTARVQYGRIRRDPVATARARSASGRKVAEARQASTRVPPPGHFAGRDHDMYDRIASLEELRAGWFYVRRTRSQAVGSDRVTVPQFAERLAEELHTLRDELEAEAYRPRPLRRHYLPKPDGTRRPIGIVCVRDRVVQAAVLRQIEPLWEPIFSPFSFAFRPRRGAHDALDIAHARIGEGLQWVVTADIQKCFDTVDHEVLLRTLGARVHDRRVLRLVHRWLENDIEELAELFGNDVGVPQGALLSPLLANIYLDPLDRHLTAARLPFVRYADDLLIFTPSRDAAAEALGVLDAFLRTHLNMALKEAKTQYSHVRDGVAFLGFELLPGSRRIASKALDRLQAKMEDFRARLASVTGPGKDAHDLLEERNAIIRGWRNYFAERSPPEVTAQLATLGVAIAAGEEATAPQWLKETQDWLLRERVEAIPSARGGAMHDISAEYPGASDEAAVECPPSGREDSAARGGRARSGAARSESSGDDATSAPDARDVMIADRRMFMLAHGAYLTMNEGELVVVRRRVELARARLEDLDLVFIHAMHARMSVEAQVACAEAGVPMVISERGGTPVAAFEPVSSRRAELRARQVLRRHDPVVIAAGLSMLQGKVTNQAALLQYFAKYQRKTGDQRALTYTAAATEIRALARRIGGLDPAGAGIRQVAMGLEGRAAATYWRSFGLLLPDSASFPGRVTRGAGDSWNQCLNYAYGILYAEVWTAVVSFGLDPYFGIMHGSTRDEGSLVFDLIEELRAPFADRIVLALFGRGLRPTLGLHGVLRTSTRRKLAGAFLRRWNGSRVRRGGSRLTGRELLHAQVRALAGLYRGEGKYRSFRMKW